MVKLIRNPLTWIVVAEVIVVAALIVLAWNAVASVARTSAQEAVAVQAGSAPPTESPVPDIGALGGPQDTTSRPLPGLNVDPAFWLGRLIALNQGQADFEQLEWQLVHTAAGAAQRYLETVVLPSVQGAEKAGRL